MPTWRVLTTMALAWPGATARTLASSDRRTMADRGCAWVDVQASSSWTTAGMVGMAAAKAFSLEVHVAHWVPYSKVRLAWKDDVEISDVYNANIAGGADGGNELVIQLTPAVPAESKFQVMGSGTLSLRPAITCTDNEAPPPAPPRANDCEQLAAYRVANIAA